MTDFSSINIGDCLHIEKAIFGEKTRLWVIVAEKVDNTHCKVCDVDFDNNGDPYVTDNEPFTVSADAVIDIKKRGK